MTIENWMSLPGFGATRLPMPQDAPGDESIHHTRGGIERVLFREIIFSKI